MVSKRIGRDAGGKRKFLAIIDDTPECMRAAAYAAQRAKASGGGATEGKIIAARRAGIPVLMVRRPPPEPGPRVDTADAAIAWLREMLESGSGYL